MAEENTNSNTDENSKLIGLVAQFDDPESLVQACDQARQAGYTKTDAFSPFPVHGIDPALGNCDAEPMKVYIPPDQQSKPSSSRSFSTPGETDRAHEWNNWERS